MRKVDLFNLIGAVVILMFSISYFFSDELAKAFTTLGISIILGLPVLFKIKKK